MERIMKFFFLVLLLGWEALKWVNNVLIRMYEALFG